MNKIYKVIWSKARNCYVVVSELAKRNAKGSGVRSSRMRVAGALSALLVSAYLVGGYGVQAAWAEEDKQATHYYSVKSSEQGSGSNYDNDGATGTNAIAIGPKAKGTSNQSIAIGFGANAGDLSNFGKSIAIGSGASASGSDAIALGNGAIASMSSSSSSSSLFPLNGGTIAIGLKANAAKDWGIAIGSNAVASEEYAVAIGNYAEAAEKYGTSIGNNATVNSIYGTALGSGAEVKSQAEGGVAIGYASVANRAAGTAGYNPSTGKASTIDSVVWKSTDGAVSVGDPNGDNTNSNKITRQITGVAAGSEDTDAVNVAQLKAALEAGGGGGATYTAGNGISIDKENKNAINVNNGDGLKIDSNNKLAVNTGDGLEFDSGALKVKSGEIASDAEGFAKAAAVFAEVRPSDGKYVKKAFSTATNLAILDTQLGQTTNALKTEIKDREAAISNEAAARINADKELSDRMGALGADGNYIKTANNVTQNLSALDTELKTTATALDGKAAVDGSNVKTPATWGSKLGTGVVTDGNGELVTGGTVYTSIEDTQKAITVATDAKLAGKADKSTTLQGYGIKDAYTKTEADGMFATQASVNNKADKSTTLAGYGITNAYTKTETTSEINKAITGKADKASTLAGYGITNAYTKTEADAANSALSDRIGTIAEDGIIIEADKNIAYNLAKVDTALKGATTKVQELFETKANADASNVGLTAENRAAWGAKLGGGTVKRGDSSLVTGGVMYDELRPADGQFVKQANTTAQNLTALDTTLGEVKKSSDNIEKTLQILEMGTDINFELIGDLADEINQRTQEIETIKKMDGVVSPAGTSKADEFVKGSTVYNEVRPADGNYVRQANTTAENLTELDTQVKANADAISLKANAADVYTKTESDGRFAQKADSLSGYGIKDAYTKTEVDNAIGGKADKSTTLQGYGITDAYTKAETDTALAGKADAATTLAGYGITNAYTKDEVDASVNGKADKATTLEGYGIADAYTKNEADSKFLTQASIDNKADKSTTLQGYGITDAYTKNEADNKFLTQASIVNKADKASSLSGYGIKDAYTITETTNAINTAVAGKADRSTTLEGYGITDAYTKTATDNAIGKAVLNKADKASSLSGYGIKDAYTITETTNAINTAVAGKADRATTLAGYDITDAYTKTETDSAITTAVADKANKATTLKGYGITDAYTQTQTNEAIKAAAATKADKATTLQGYGITDAYTRTEADNTFLTKASIDNKADKSTTLAGYGITDAYTKTETEAKLSGKADVATTLAGYGITDAYTRAETDTALAGKANKSTTLAGYGITNAYTKTETTSEINKAITGKADKASTLAGYGITNAYTKTEADAANSALSDRIGTIAEDGIIIEADKNIAYNLTKVDTALKGATTKVQELFETKANADASNVGLTAENRAAWGAKLGGGAVKSGDSSLVTGGVVYSEVRPADGQFVKQANTTAQNLTALDTTLGEVKKSSDNIEKTLQILEMGTDINFELIGDLADEINQRTQDIETIKAMDGVVAPAGTSKADEFVKGSTVYNEVRPADGAYVKKDNSTGENLTALDTQVKANADAISLKANAADVYTKTESDGRFAQKADSLSGYGIKDAYTKTEVDNAMGEKANKSTTLQGYGITDAYTKVETDTALAGKADAASTLAGYGITDAYTKDEVDASVNGKADKATTLQGYGIADAYTKTETETKLSGKADAATTLAGYGIADAYTKNEADSKFLTQASIGNKADKSTTLQGYGITDAFTKEETTSAIDTAVANKADKADTLAGYGINDAYTKTETDAADLALSDRIGTISKNGLVIKTDKNIAENLILIDTAIQNQTGTKELLDKKANVDASNVGINAKAADGSSVDNSAAWGSALGTGVVEKGNDRLVTGATVYNEVNVKTDGQYVKAVNTAGENLTALDAQMQTNTSAIATNTKNIADNAANIQANTDKIEDNTVQIAVAQRGVEDAIGAINVLATITGVVEDASYERMVDLNKEVEQTKAATKNISVDENGATVISGTTKFDGDLEAGDIKAGDIKAGVVSVTKLQVNGTNVTVALTKEGSVEKGNGGFVKGDAVYDYLNERESLEIGRNTTKIAMGKDSAAGTDSVAIGNGNDAGKDSVAIGNANKTTGTEKSLALGYQNTISGNQSVALGDSNTVSGNQSVALGDSNTVRGKQSIAIGHGHSVTGDHSGAFGDPATISGNYAFSVGNNNNISGSNSVAIGNDNKISGNKTFVMGNNVDTNASNAVVLGDGSEGVDNAVSVGSSKLGGQRQIKNVASGEDDTDAATWGQVKDVAQNAYNNAVYLNNSINRMDSKINKVGAGAAALAALHPIEMDNKFGMGIGYGNYRDAHSMALGVFYRPKDNLMFSIGGSMGNGENMVNAGISIALDKGFTNSKAMMARTIKAQGEALDEQRKANAEQEAKIHNLEAENAAIKEQNARLEARLAAIEAKLAK